MKLVKEDDFIKIYSYSLYWAITTIVTVGYGDIYPINQKELYFGMLTILFGTAIFGYSINHIGSIIDNMY